MVLILVLVLVSPTVLVLVWPLVRGVEGGGSTKTHQGSRRRTLIPRWRRCITVSPTRPHTCTIKLRTALADNPARPRFHPSNTGAPISSIVNSATASAAGAMPPVPVDTGVAVPVGGELAVAVPVGGEVAVAVAVGVSGAVAVEVAVGGDVAVAAGVLESVLVRAVAAGVGAGVASGTDGEVGKSANRANDVRGRPWLDVRMWMDLFRASAEIASNRWKWPARGQAANSRHSRSGVHPLRVYSMRAPERDGSGSGSRTCVTSHQSESWCMQSTTTWSNASSLKNRANRWERDHTWSGGGGELWRGTIGGSRTTSGDPPPVAICQRVAPMNVDEFIKWRRREEGESRGRRGKR